MIYEYNTKSGLAFKCRAEGDDTMKVFLCGGGADIQTMEAIKRLNEVIDHSKPCLYIPLAMKQDVYDSCYEWIKGELKNIDVPHIEMVRSEDELATKNMPN